MITSLQKTLHPIPSPSYNTTMALYKDSNYTTPHTGPEVTLFTEEFLYVGVFILGGDPSNAVLVMKNCYATPTNDADYPVRYYIIQNSCPNIHDGTMSVEENGVSRQGRFSVQMFKFVGSHDEVYLHCAVSLCDIAIGSCRPMWLHFSLFPFDFSGCGPGKHLDLSSSLSDR
ncbi:pancreatic secretory granule membrane major glycoprotein GP2-like [Rana temporaria]|uniref:pancreatic secretory granule membrane major glycoprotein GP2-like n=1 Tax=Rana temporaria TaxID=8407 RepID=UPI001AAC5B4D|nr:pancreatic secretory granule membrane major glycoprotein GP2-like [Rana temporaria]